MSQLEFHLLLFFFFDQRYVFKPLYAGHEVNTYFIYLFFFFFEGLGGGEGGGKFAKLPPDLIYHILTICSPVTINLMTTY